MRSRNLIIIMLGLAVFAATFFFSFNNNNPDITEKTDIAKGESKNPGFQVPDKGIHILMGKDEQQVKKQFGEPERVDPTSYGYDWWIYGRDTSKYLQIGVDSDTHKVVTIYALGDDLPTAPFHIGDRSGDIYQKVPLHDTVSLDYHNAKVKFEFTEDDLVIRPLIKYDGHWVQLYFDHVTDRLAGVRYLTGDVLVKQKPYTMMVTGVLEAEPEPDPAKSKAIDAGMTKEIFDMTNILRKRYGKDALAWNEAAGKAAVLHSKDMYEGNYFSHDSKKEGGLADRLHRQDITFVLAGENIAARYTDPAAVVNGWLNSADHRKNLLNEGFRSLGTGVYHKYYTQDFVTAAGGS